MTPLRTPGGRGLRDAALAAALLSAVLAPPVGATIPLEGTFEAARACPAFQSFRRGTNPGGVAVEPGRRYAVAGANADPPSHYLLVVPGADPPDRWVATDCGRILPPGSGERSAPPDDGGTGDAALVPPGAYVLALTWHPAFCESAPGERECRTRRAAGAAGEGLVLHGLWLRDRDATWCRADGPPRLSRATRRALEAAMPGTMAGFEDYQWEKHGACFGVAADDYFAAAAALARAVDAAAVGALMDERVGRAVSDAAVADAFDDAFGPGAGRRAWLTCERDGRRTLVREVRVNLDGPIGRDPDLGALIRAAPPARGGCRGGIVDPAGLQ